MFRLEIIESGGFSFQWDIGNSLIERIFETRCNIVFSSAIPQMLHEANFTYDSSMPVFDNKPPFYPYTLDYAISHECMITPCPTKSYPGLWEVGMIMLEGELQRMSPWRMMRI